VLPRLKDPMRKHHIFTVILLALPACDSEGSGKPESSHSSLAAPSSEARAAQANCVPNPVDDTPECCPYGSIVRPLQNLCTNAPDLSPRIDSNGVYLGEGHVSDQVSSNVLQVCAVHVIDNGEGGGWPHGPHGNLYIDFFKPDEPLDLSPDGADKRRIRNPRLLKGPHNTHGDTDEWLDDEALLYRSYPIFAFDLEGPTTDQVVMRVWESDSLSEDGNFWGRRNDVLGMELIDRASTAQAAQWIEFHKYTNDHPRARTDEVALRIRLQTGGTCPLDY
jgi:hypothetical protein